MGEFMKVQMIALMALGMGIAGCNQTADARTDTPPSAPSDGQPYVLAGTQVWSVPDPVSGRDYDIFVSLPASYDSQPSRRYPVVYVTDADYAFPIIRQIARRVNLEGPAMQEFILIGLSYAKNDNPMDSRRRDYTPTPNGPSNSGDAEHGGGAAYQTYLKEQVLPYVDTKFRTDAAQRVLLGHSYGGLLGAQIMFTDPALFSGYILGSPSFWYDKNHITTMEAAYARTHTDLPANVFMYVGAYEIPGPTHRHTKDVDMVRDMQIMERTLQSRNYPSLKIQSTVLADEDHLTVAPVGFTRALLAVLPTR